MLRCVTAAITRASVVGVAAGLALSVASVPAVAATSASADVQQVTSVTVFLKSPHPARLAALAAAHGLTRTQRLTELADLLPSAATRRSVAHRLVARGLTVTGQTAWSLTASGSASAIANRFGTRPKAGRRPSASRLRAATGALPTVPSTLRDDVTAAFPTTAGPAVAHHATTTLTGTDVRRAYGAAGATESSGQHDAGTTIATVQFADFRSGTTSDAATSAQAADLTAYAAEHGLTDPVASGQYHAVTVDGGPSSDDDAQSGEADVEVDLDQESILSTAPTAHQRAYFAPNTSSGFADAFSAVLDDARSGADPHITTLSVSWGECESGSGNGFVGTLEPILESLTAAGVTVFASSGDDGIYDCGTASNGAATTSTVGVDFPASSPYVVAVGGTNLTARTSAANTGSNWTETGWSCDSATACELDTGGSGGGVSGFAAPAYQTDYVSDSPFAGSAHRLVPDIAADGDPDTGFVVYSSNPTIITENRGSPDVQLGGTSLAAPLSAAQFDNALGDAGRTSGVGDIHAALYSAYARTAALPSTSAAKVFRDVTTGSNGAAADRGSDPSVRAQAGYDTVSGLGGVLWPALLPYLMAWTTPTASGALTLPNATRSGSTYTVAGSWRATTSGGSRTVLTVTAVGGGTAYRATSTASAGSFRFAGRPGSTYRLIVTTTDAAGRSAARTATLVTPIDDRSFRFSTKWTRKAGSSDFGGSHALASAKSASATVSARGRTFSLQVATGPARGKLAVYLGRTKIATVDEYSKHAGHRVVRVYARSSVAARTFTLRPLARRSPASSGVTVALDSLIVTQ